MNKRARCYWGAASILATIFVTIYVYIFTFATYESQKTSDTHSIITDPNLLEAVDPFIGTSGTGHTTPGAKAPFGMMYMSPVNVHDPIHDFEWWDYCSGYQFEDTTFEGIAHTALTGTGIAGLLDVIVSPFQHGATIDKKTERASPGYYAVTVDSVDMNYDSVKVRSYEVEERSDDERT